MHHLILAFALLSACHDTDTTLDCEAIVDDGVATVVNLGWTPPGSGESYVEFGADDSMGLRTWTLTDEGPLSFPLIGVPAETEVHWRGVSEVDGVRCTCEGTTATGSLPSDIEGVEVSVDIPEDQDGVPFFLGSYYQMFGDVGRLIALDRAGNIVWYAYSDEGTFVIDLQPALDGNGILYNQYRLEESLIRRISLLGEVLGEVVTPGAHHMFAQIPDGTLVYQQMDPREHTDPNTGETDEWVGDALAEIAPDGTITRVFSVWDWLVPTWNEYMSMPSLVGGLDWTHGNAIHYEADLDRYQLSLGHTADILEIDRQTGEVEEAWGTDGLPADPPFSFQHDTHWLDTGNLLMYMTDPETDTSGAAEYAMNEDGSLEQVWRTGFDLKTQFLGGARRLANGNTFVSNSANGRMQEVTPEGAVVWEVQSHDHEAFGQMMPIDDFYWR